MNAHLFTERNEKRTLVMAAHETAGTIENGVRKDSSVK